MSKITLDQNQQEIILFKDNQQVMMEWEKPYMEASIDILNPHGDVLEIGFGFGYSATQIMKYKPKSYTIIECDPNIIQNINRWREKYPETPIHIVKGKWQDTLFTLGTFDEIYFDDYPFDITQQSSHMEKIVSQKRINIFLDLCIQNHTKIGSKISWYLSTNDKHISLSSDTSPFVQLTLQTIDISIPSTCSYRNINEQQCTIPLLIKNKEYNFKEAQRYSLKQIQHMMP
jgi:hypothetical protein